MPSSKKSKTQLYIRVDLRPRLAALHEKALEKHPETNRDFGGFVMDLLEDVVRKEDFLADKWPNLDLAWHDYDALGIMDNNKSKKIFEVYRHNDKIKCHTEGSFTCEHVEYAKAKVEKVALLHSLGAYPRER